MRVRRIVFGAVAMATLLAITSVVPSSRTGASPGASAVSTASAAAAGQWSSVFKMPVPAAHMALLPNGKILMWVAGKRTYIWDPSNFTSVARTAKGSNLMCAGFIQLSDGTVFVVGGQGPGGGTVGLVQTSTFDWRTNTWTKGPNMTKRRWYPSVAALPNGEALIIGGGPNVAEVRQTDGTLRKLTTAVFNHVKRYPFVQVGPEGLVGYYGEEVELRSLDSAGTGQWTVFGNRDAIQRRYGSFAMFDIGKVLVAGGGLGGTVPTNSAVVVANVGDSLVSTPTGSLAQGRRQGHLTVLADGSVLYSGGQASTAEQVSLKRGVNTAELWNPQTGVWTTLARARVTRQYHSTAILLPDARVLTAGGGHCAKCGTTIKYNESNGEIFSPPYLFDSSGGPAVRPVINSAPTVASPGGTYDVDITSDSGVSKMALVRLGAETHAVDQGQRYVPLTVVSVAGSQYQITLPTEAGALPPGYYMLFAIDGSGVPSVSQMVQVQ